MKFIDEVTIQVQAGKGGDGCCSFRREKFIPFGGPDGGDGGNGGDIYCKSTSSINTLIDLNYQKLYRSSKGRSGSGNLRSGKSGEDLIINVPIGTIVWDYDNKYVLGDLTTEGQTLLVAKGGKGGLGNHNFKSSTNRAPRKIIKGQLGEERILRLELRLLADVGLLGLPNSGKSTLINAGSAANAKIANYPFSTLKPQLGVVKSSQGSFVMADLPGILAGAAQGVGLGIRFLKHLSRNKLLLHLVDLSQSLEYSGAYSNNDYIKQGNDIDNDISIKTSGSGSTSAIDYQRIIENLWTQIKIVENEIANYDDVNLSKIERWIVINKIDLLTAKQLSLLQQLWQQQVNNIQHNASATSASLNNLDNTENCLIEPTFAVDNLDNFSAVAVSNNFNNTDDSVIDPELAVKNLDNSATVSSSNNINNLKVFWISAYNAQGVNSLLQNIIEHLNSDAVKQLKIC